MCPAKRAVILPDARRSSPSGVMSRIWFNPRRSSQRVTVRTILGTVGNSGNAVNTPAHLHFAVFTHYDPAAECRFLAINPLPLLRDR